MALPASPPITLQQIYTEFGAPLGTPLTSMVRGGAYVPNHSGNAGIPTAPPLDMLDFLGASNIGATLQNPTSASAVTISPADASAQLNWNSAGNCTRSINNAPATTLYSWLLAGAASDFQFMASGLTGTAPSGSTFNTWISGGTGVGWTLTRTSDTSGSTSCSFTLQIRRASDSVVVATATISLTATVDV